MSHNCHCGMPIEEPARRSECHECGAACCRSCVIDVDTQTYCRWCATAFIAA